MHDKEQRATSQAGVDNNNKTNERGRIDCVERKPARATFKAFTQISTSACRRALTQSSTEQKGLVHLPASKVLELLQECHHANRWQRCSSEDSNHGVCAAA